MSNNKDSLKLVCVRLPKDLHLLAKKRALEEGRALQDLIAKILQGYLEICEKIE